MPATTPEDLKKYGRALIASVVGTYNMDCKIQEFIRHNPNAVIVQLGCGLDTSYFRNSSWYQTWYEIDTPSVIKLRNKYIEPHSHDIALSYDTQHIISTHQYILMHTVNNSIAIRKMDLRLNLY